MGEGFIFYICRLKKNRHVFILGPDLFNKFNPGCFIRLTCPHEGDVGDDAQEVTLVFLPHVNRLFIVGGQEDFRAAAHPEHLVVFVQSFGHKGFGLFEQDFIDIRKV
jgi:hypothetical protein